MIAVRKLLAFFSFRRISGQIAALVIISPIVIHFLIGGFFFLHAPPGEPPPHERPRREIGPMAQLISATPAAERPRLIEAINGAFPQLALELQPPDFKAPDADAIDPPTPLPPGYPHHIGPGFSVFMLPGEAHPDHVGIRLPDGAVLTARLGPGRQLHLFGPWMTTLVFIIASITVLGLWAMRTLSAPLSAFAKAAESFSLNGEASPLPESGPAEIRAAARALNRMRERITALMNDRMQMLAAISHDLRTPITRLRLRSEFIEDETQRNHMLRDLNQMRSMLESVLSFLRNDHTVERMTLVDLSALLHQICDQFSDLGHTIVYRGPAQLTITARPDELSRAVTNLVENAVKFGANVTIAVEVVGEYAVIEVQDDGPGIADARKAAMLEPFVRGDTARNMDEGGFGLGLSIAQSITQAHGGVLSLHDRKPHGLTVRIVLPHQIEQKSTEKSTEKSAA
ncbi:ATP-binding protein [Bradyrhizobium prioriisuperbiae]|uniref:ATP-binding protein n=1 Tax=Bradyrhizobium prioriisuperbiae TaxID=2854389 RepID=UPI0028E3A46D|nr:ATP-binding protein [Bradyrhizobium prioritasuperba]